MGWVRVGLLWDKQHETQIVRIGNILKFGVYRASIEQDTAIQKLQTLLTTTTTISFICMTITKYYSIAKAT